MKTFIIINGGLVRLIESVNIYRAYHSAINYCDLSKEVILREVSGFHNCTDKHLRTRNVTSFNQKIDQQQLNNGKMKELKEQTQFDKFVDQIILAVDSHHGQYIPISLISLGQTGSGVMWMNQGDFIEEIEDIQNESEWMWESWQAILDNSIFEIDGKQYRLEQNEDLWFVPVDIETPEDWYI